MSYPVYDIPPDLIFSRERPALLAAQDRDLRAEARDADAGAEAALEVITASYPAWIVNGRVIYHPMFN